MHQSQHSTSQHQLGHVDIQRLSDIQQEFNKHA